MILQREVRRVLLLRKLILMTTAALPEERAMARTLLLRTLKMQGKKRAKQGSEVTDMFIMSKMALHISGNKQPPLVVREKHMQSTARRNGISFQYETVIPKHILHPMLLVVIVCAEAHVPIGSTSRRSSTGWSGTWSARLLLPFEGPLRSLLSMPCCICRSREGHMAAH